MQEQTTLNGYRKIVHTKHEVEETSLQAHKEINSEIGKRHELILRALKELCKNNGDATDSEITRYLGKWDPNFTRPRRYELVNKFRLVGYSRTRMCRITGKSCMAWEIL